MYPVDLHFALPIHVLAYGHYSDWAQLANIALCFVLADSCARLNHVSTLAVSCAIYAVSTVSRKGF